MARTMVASDQESRDIINWSEIKMYDKSEVFELLHSAADRHID